MYGDKDSTLGCTWQPFLQFFTGYRSFRHLQVACKTGSDTGNLEANVLITQTSKLQAPPWGIGIVPALKLEKFGVVSRTAYFGQYETVDRSLCKVEHSSPNTYILLPLP